jgi:carbonic anhydrase
MTDDTLESLLTDLEEAARNPAPVAAAGEVVVRVSCSMADPASAVSLWPADGSWTLRTVTTLGNQAWAEYDGEQVVNGSMARFATEYDVRAIQIIGHTGCSVVEDAYDRYIASDREVPPGIEARLNPLISLVSDAVDAGVVDPSVSPRSARYRLVEYNVVRQVESLRERLGAPVPVVGYVHDQDGAYGSFPQKHYLVSVDGETDPDTIRENYPATESVPLSSLLS